MSRAALSGIRSVPPEQVGFRSKRTDILFLAWLFSGSALLFAPSAELRSLIILSWGIFIFYFERGLGLPVPATPGFLFWLGNVLSYVVGGMGTNWFFESGELGLRYLDRALLYLGLGLGAYTLGLSLVRQRHPRTTSQPKTVYELHFHPMSIVIVALLFILPVMGNYLLPLSGTGGLYYNIVVGALQSIEQLPMILFAFYLLQNHWSWWALSLFLTASLAVPFEGILLGYGRSKMIFAVISLVLVWMGLMWYAGKRIPQRAKTILVAMPFLLMLFFGLATTYRETVAFDGELTLNERLRIAQSSMNTFALSGNSVIDSTGALLTRLVEAPSIELLHWAESGAIDLTGWTLGDLKQITLSWVPRTFFPEKGVGYGRDIMEYYGLSPSWNNIPVTVLSDSYRRLGLVGVLGLYFIMGVASTIIALKLIPQWRGLGLLLVFYFALNHLQLYSSDALSVFTLYVYRLPSSALVIYILLRFARIWRPSKTPLLA